MVIFHSYVKLPEGISYSVLSILPILCTRPCLHPAHRSFHLPEALGILRHAIRPHHGRLSPKEDGCWKKFFLTIHPPKKKVNFSGSWSDLINKYHSKLTSFFYIIHNWLFRLDLKIAEALENYYSGFRIQIYWIRPNSTSERKFSHPSVSAILNQ